MTFRSEGVELIFLIAFRPASLTLQLFPQIGQFCRGQEFRFDHTSPSVLALDPIVPGSEAAHFLAICPWHFRSSRADIASALCERLIEYFYYGFCTGYFGKHANCERPVYR